MPISNSSDTVPRESMEFFSGTSRALGAEDNSKGSAPSSSPHLENISDHQSLKAFSRENTPPCAL